VKIEGLNKKGEKRKEGWLEKRGEGRGGKKRKERKRKKERVEG